MPLDPVELANMLATSVIHAVEVGRATGVEPPACGKDDTTYLSNSAGSCALSLLLDVDIRVENQSGKHYF